MNQESTFEALKDANFGVVSRSIDAHLGAISDLLKDRRIPNEVVVRIRDHLGELEHCSNAIRCRDL